MIGAASRPRCSRSPCGGPQASASAADRPSDRPASNDRAPPGPEPGAPWLAAIPWRQAALALAILLAFAPLLVQAGPAAIGSPPSSLPETTAPRPQAAEAIHDSGSFHRAKVRILGIPVLTVASPVVSGSPGPSALQRAQVIEGNLELLYRSQEVCTPSEAIGEQWIEGLLPQRGDTARACDANQLGLLGRADQLKVEIAPDSGELPVLHARVPNRELPLPLLSVTDDDARLNGTTPQRLAERWRSLLERRLRLARYLLEPGVLGQRFRVITLVEVALLVLLSAALLLWRRISRRLVLLETAEAGPTRPAGSSHAGAWRRELVISGLHLLSRGLLGVVVLVLWLMGVAVLAVPGQIPLGIALLLQPFGVMVKLVIGWLIALLLKIVLMVVLRQWLSNPVLAPEQRARRNQRYRSLLRISQRLVNLLCIVLVALWVLVEIPGIRDLSNNALLASGALLGALALVFQDLLRDAVAGLTVLLEDRYAIGDQISVDGLSGEVIDVGLLSSELRGPDQRLIVIPNSQCKRVENSTKLRSGQELVLTLSHQAADPRRALEVIGAAAAAFAVDPVWRVELLEAPQLLGLRKVSPHGMELALLLITRAGRQGAVHRELLLRLVEALRGAGIPLADGAQIASP
jgi:small conductance mechanosensitive channel